MGAAGPNAGRPYQGRTGGASATCDIMAGVIALGIPASQERHPPVSKLPPENGLVSSLVSNKSSLNFLRFFNRLSRIFGFLLRYRKTLKINGLERDAGVQSVFVRAVQYPAAAGRAQRAHARPGAWMTSAIHCSHPERTDRAPIRLALNSNSAFGGKRPSMRPQISLISAS